MEYSQERAEAEQRRMARRLELDQAMTLAANAECAVWVNAMESFGFKTHPGLTPKENLVEFANWWAKRTPAGDPFAFAGTPPRLQSSGGRCPDCFRAPHEGSCLMEGIR